VTTSTSCCVQIYGGRRPSLYTGTSPREQRPTRANIDTSKHWESATSVSWAPSWRWYSGERTVLDYIDNTTHYPLIRFRTIIVDRRQGTSSLRLALRIGDWGLARTIIVGFVYLV